MIDQDDATEYYVVINGEEQYSIWPSTRPLPAGWSTVGEPGPKAKCLDYIERTWVDMRPRSLRAAMLADGS
jgi:MbtH protein